MPRLTFDPSKEQMKRAYPIAIVKGDDKKFHNKFLYLDPDEHTETGVLQVEIPMDCRFSVLPSTDKDKRNIFYVAGASGSGKSWFAKMVAQNYAKMYPDRPIYLISKLEADETIDSCEPAPIRLDYKEFIDNPPDINKLSNSMVIFDDYDVIGGAEGEAVHTLIDDVATMGRKHGEGQGCITMMCLTHALTNYKKTRVLLNESDHYVVYPQNTNAKGLRYLLGTYMGLDNDDIKRLKKMGRYVVLSKNYPQFILSGNRCELLHLDE